MAGQFVQPRTAPELSNHLRGVSAITGRCPASDKAFHRDPPLVEVAEVSIANRTPDQFRDGRFFGLSLNVQGAPELIVEIELRPPHDV
jgi:hypothetical protein